MLYVIGRRPSKSVLAITRRTGIKRYTGKKKTRAGADNDMLVNYGLAGDHMDAFYRQVPSARRLPTINHHVGYSKLSVINKAEKEDIKVPDSKLALKQEDKVKDFIEKRINSVGGVGIREARAKKSINGKYYQRFVKNRLYELRVHAFKWTDNWVVQKRVGPDDVIAWNFKQGGRFITVQQPENHKIFVRAREMADKILDLVNMSFGAVDMIVDKEYTLYFIEINSAPGFTELSEPIYVNAFNELKALPKKKLLALAR